MTELELLEKIHDTLKLKANYEKDHSEFWFRNVEYSIKTANSDLV